jgi:thioredoxin 1
MKKAVFLLSIGLVLILSNCNVGTPARANENPAPTESGAVKVMTNDMFKQKIFNYTVNKEWKYEGNLPAIIDFYATWCGPCRMLSPKVEEIAKEYAGKIVVYKVDTDQEPVLAQSLGIQNLPTLLFIPVKGQPRVTMGAVPKETLVKAVNDVLLVK